MKTDIKKIEEKLILEIKTTSDESELEEIRVKALGRKGIISELLKTLGAMSEQDRQTHGLEMNNLKNTITQAFAEHHKQLKSERRAKQLAAEAVDVTLPVDESPESRGRIHPISYVIEEIWSIFRNMGFSLAEGPDVETDYYNFTALNFPADHPAREMHDTFFLSSSSNQEKRLLRTHTSPVQIRTMEIQKPPIRVVIPGKAYRIDSDTTHTPMFHQLEGLVIDETADMRNMRWVVEEFCRLFFGVKDLEMRFRSSFFPFTEPSIELDIRCDRSSRTEVRLGEGNDWMEILGCGMVHRNVLETVGIDPEKYQGFAWGMGIDRLAMLKYGIPDLRAFFDSDTRWLSHYGFRPLDIPSMLGLRLSNASEKN